MKIIRINIDDTMDEIDIKEKCSEKNIIGKIKKHITSTGNDNINKLYQWTYEDNIIECYGWHDGEAGFENVHELIPNGISGFLEENSSEKLLFGNIFLTLKNSTKQFIDLPISYYGEIYNSLHQGFDTCEEEDDDNEDDDEDDIDNVDEEDNTFIEKDCDDSEDDEYVPSDSFSDDELDEDLNEY